MISGRSSLANDARAVLNSRRLVGTFANSATTTFFTAVHRVSIREGDSSDVEKELKGVDDKDGLVANTRLARFAAFGLTIQGWAAKRGDP